MTDLTSRLSALAHLKLHASEELSGDHPVGYAHHHSWDEEQNEQQQHIPGKKAKMEKTEKRSSYKCHFERSTSFSEHTTWF